MFMMLRTETAQACIQVMQGSLRGRETPFILLKYLFSMIIKREVENLTFNRITFQQTSCLQVIYILTYLTSKRWQIMSVVC